MRAIVLGQVPNAHAAVSVAADDLPLVGVNHNIVGGASVAVASLDRAGPGLPNLDSAILRARDHPFPFAMECDAGNIASVAFKSMQGIWVRRFDVVELNSMMARGREESLVG